MKTERHRIERAVAQRKFDFNLKEVTELVAEVPSNPDVLEGVFDASYQLAAAASVVAPKEPMLRYAVRIAAQSAAAIFALHDQNVRGKPLSYRGMIGDREVVIEGYKPFRGLGAANYQLGLYCSLISRDITANRDICLVPPASIRQCGVQADEYQYEWIVMLVRISNGENLAGMLDSLSAETAPDRVEIASRDHIEQTLWLARAAEAVHAGNAAAFNDALAKALAFHRKIWEEKPNIWLGYMSFGATAIACWALDQGVGITVTSEYMPNSLLHI